MMDEASDDSELLRRFAADHSETAFAAFVERRAGFVYSAALRRVSGDAHLAGDVTQSVFLAASRNASELARHDRLLGWLHATTARTALWMLRDARLRKTREQEAAAMNELERAAESADDDEHQRMRDALDDALETLGEKDREAVFQRFFGGCSYAGIGALQKTNTDAARMRVSRALDKMRAQFARRGITSTAAALATMLTAEAAVPAPAGLAASVTGSILAASAATATVGTTAGGIGALLAFMNTTKITITVLIAILAGIGGTFYATQTERASARALAAAEKTHAQLQRQLQSAAEREASEQNPSQSSEASASTTTSTTTQPLDPVAAGQAFLDAHPEVREKLNAYARSDQAGRYASVYHKLGWSAEQIASFEEQHPMPMTMGDMKDIPGYGRVIIATSPAINTNWAAELRETIGDEDAAPFLEALKREIAARELPSEFARSLYYTDTPLTPEQAQQLTDACVEVSSAQGRTSHLPEDWDALIEKARAFLSPEQLDAFIEQRAYDDYNAERFGWTKATTTKTPAKNSK